MERIIAKIMDGDSVLLESVSVQIQHLTSDWRGQFTAPNGRIFLGQSYVLQSGDGRKGSFVVSNILAASNQPGQQVLFGGDGPFA